MIKLSARGLIPRSKSSSAPFIARVVDGASIDLPSERCVYLASEPTECLPPGFRAYLSRVEQDASAPPDTYVLGADHSHIRAGDVVRIDPHRRTLSWIYRSSSRFNTLLLTERCNSRCVMCSQPPKEADDGWILDELESAIPLIPNDAVEIGLTGGEPTLLGLRLVQLLEQLRDQLPRTSVHLLSNGRGFEDASLAQRVGRVRHHDLMIGIPLYSDVPSEHDFVVQALGAFDETVRGILHLKRNAVRIEIRFVIHAETASRLPEFARFVARNLTFVDQVALMGLEPVGYAKMNIDSVWIDPLDYQSELLDAVHTLRRAGVATAIFNHQLCTLDPRVHEYAAKSISDWKNEYFAECANCSKREACGGFFSSATTRRSRGIRAT